jgi:hypothetical protein
LKKRASLDPDLFQFKMEDCAKTYRYSRFWTDRFYVFDHEGLFLSENFSPHRSCWGGGKRFDSRYNGFRERRPDPP